MDKILETPRAVWPALPTSAHWIGLRALLPAAALLLTAAGGCRPSENASGEEAREERLAELDVFLAELGGRPTADLSRAQRWRMISSIGAGLPPSNFEASNMPDPRSRGAVLVQTYCNRCHWLPSPRQHSVREWPILVRRMQIRAEALRDRMGGAMTRELVGDLLLGGWATAPLPSEKEMEAIIEYLQAHAFPAAMPNEIEDGPDADLFRNRCSRCHEIPAPKAHTAAEWETVVAKMQAFAPLMDLAPLSDQERERVLGYLRSKSGS